MPRLAIVTGASGDIGRATVRALGATGATVLGCDLSGEADRIDVTDPDAVHGWIASLPQAPQAAVVNAAVVVPGSAAGMSPADWRKQIDVNLNGAFYVAQAAARRMLEEHVAGRIVFVGSWAAHVPDTAIPAYCAAKAGLRMLMRCMAKELAPNRILVNEVAPGYVDAGLSRRMFESTPGLRERCEARVPVGSLISAEEVAREVVRLCDPELAHVTGSVSLMDGGLSL